MSAQTDEAKVQEVLALFQPGVEIGKRVVDELLGMLRREDLPGLLDRMDALTDDELGCGLFVALSRLRGNEMREETAR